MGQAAPAIKSLSPDCGAAAGGTTVTVEGSGFLAGSTTVAFGSTAATSVVVKSASELTARAPAGSDGTVAVTVTVSGTASPTSSADEFTYAGCAYVANFNSGTVSVINTARSLVTDTIRLPTSGKAPHPDALALTADNEQLYVADPANETVYAYSTKSYTLEKSHDLTAKSEIADPVQLALVASPSAELLVANSAANDVTAYSLTSDLPSSLSPSKTVTAGFARGLAAMTPLLGSPDLLLVSYQGDAVGELDTSGWSSRLVAARAGQFVEPEALGLSSDGATAYVADGTGRIYALSTSPPAIVGAIGGTSGATSVPSAISCSTASTCFEANARDNTIGTISTATAPGSMEGTPVASADIDGPVALAGVPGTPTLYVVNDGGNTIGLFDSASDSMTGTIGVGANPCALVVMKS